MFVNRLEEVAACASMVLSSRSESTAATPTEAAHSSHGAPGKLEPSKTWSSDETSSGPKPSVSAFIAVSTPWASPTTGGATTCEASDEMTAMPPMESPRKTMAK